MPRSDGIDPRAIRSRSCEKERGADPSDVGDVQLLAWTSLTSGIARELARLTMSWHLNGPELQTSCTRLSEHAVKDIRAIDAAIASARNSYFYEHHSPILSTYQEQQARLEFVRAELLRERSRFAEFVVESVTDIGKECHDLVATSRERMQLYEKMLASLTKRQEIEHPLLDMLLGRMKPSVHSSSNFEGNRSNKAEGQRVASIVLNADERVQRFAEGKRASMVKSKADTDVAIERMEARASKLQRGRVLLQEGLGEGTT